MRTHVSGAAVLALALSATPALASVIYHPIDPAEQYYIPTGDPNAIQRDIDLDGNGTLDFSFLLQNNDVQDPETGPSYIHQVWISPWQSENRVVANDPPYNASPRVLAAGTSIGPSSLWSVATDQYTLIEYNYDSFNGLTTYGTWAGVADAFVGVEFSSAAGMLYGWLEVGVDASNPANATLSGWAYESTPGVAIAAGDTGIPAVPEPRLALLAAASGLALVFRRR
jgi:hypothetical protein